MGTLHKHTHRTLALLALFALLGLVGWHLPQLGRGALAYSNRGLAAARAALTSPAAAKTSAPAEKTAVPPAAKSTAPATALKLSDTPGQQAVAQTRAALEAARSASRSKTNPSKDKVASLDLAYQNYYAAVALRLSEIRARLAQLTAPGTGNSTTDSGPGPALPAEYQTLLSEVQSYGGFPQSVNDLTANTTDEAEPNGTAATATNIGSLTGQALRIGSGANTPAGDVDFWAITVPANSKVYAFVDTGGSTTSRDSIMDLIDTNGTTVLEDDDDGATATNATTTILSLAASAIAGKPLATAGTYYLRVAHFSGSTTISAYKLYVVVTTTSSSEVESNNTPALADSITPAADAGRVRTGSIGVAGDVDYYSISGVTAGSQIHVNADCDPERDSASTDIVVDLIAPDTTTVLLSIDGTPAFFGILPDSEASTITAATAGTYFVRVRHFSASGTGTYALMAAVVGPAASQVCPPIPITSNLGVAGGNFPKTSGTMTARLNRDGVQSVCGTPRTQAAPIAGTFMFDKYTFTNSAAATKCITVALTVNETAASNYMVGAFSAFVPTNLTSGWLGDPGFSSGIPPVNPRSFTVNIGAGASFDVVVFNTNTTGNGNSYSLTVFGFEGCVTPPCALTCPANITVSNAANQCGATVTFPAPTTTGACNTVTCVPASGATFPVGTTTVTCTSAGNTNGTQTCSFTVTVNDTQAPAITCPANQFVGTTGNTAVVNFNPQPIATDNCPGVQTPVCVPASGSAFPVGVTTVNCSVKDAVNNSASCSFQVTVNRLTTKPLEDQLACTGPGNVVTGGFTVTNNGVVSQTVAVTVSMPLVGVENPQTLPVGYPLLVALPGSCVTSAGNCTVAADLKTLTFTATLAAGASATANYRTQVNDQVPTGRTMTVTTSASFNNGPQVSTVNSITATCQAVGPGLIPSTSQVSDQKAGSVLVYPIYTSTVGVNSQNSRINITNIHQNLSAFIHLYFVADTCAISDAYICLTANQTASFLMVDLDPGTTGYLVAITVDGATGCPTNFNYLIGDEYVKFTSGHAANLGAEAISAIAGGLPPCDNNSVFAVLNFDGLSYNLLPTTLALDNLGSRADGNNTMLVVNAFGGDMRVSPATLGALFGVLYDDSENGFSFTISSGACQYRAIISNSAPRTTPRLDQVIPAGHTGWMRFWHRTGQAIFGAAINFNSTVGNPGAFNGGHNLHKLTLVGTTTMVVPVLPPSC